MSAPKAQAAITAPVAADHAGRSRTILNTMEAAASSTGRKQTTTNVGKDFAVGADSLRSCCPTIRVRHGEERACGIRLEQQRDRAPRHCLHPLVPLSSSDLFQGQDFSYLPDLALAPTGHHKDSRCEKAKSSNRWLWDQIHSSDAEKNFIRRGRGLCESHPASKHYGPVAAARPKLRRNNPCCWRKQARYRSS